MKIAINGFGRIGRQVLKAIKKYHGDKFDVVAINDLYAPEDNARLFKYDSNYGIYQGSVEVNDGNLVVDGDVIRVFAERDPGKLPWKELGVDIVIESTGVFKDTSKTPGPQSHIEAGAKKVIISAPAKGEDLTVVIGVNDDLYDSEIHHIISNASCTTNCLAPPVKVLHEKFGIVKGLMTTIHAVTNDQRMLDMWHKDLRRARAGAWNLIPTTTGAAKAIGLVYPKMVGRLNGMAIRVPLVDVSLVDLVAVVEKEVTVDVVNEAFKKASEKGDMAPYLGYVDEPLVSSDFINDTDSCSFDSLATMTQGNMVKVLGWYDNEAGYAHRLADLAALIAKKL